MLTGFFMLYWCRVYEEGRSLKDNRQVFHHCIHITVHTSLATQKLSVRKHIQYYGFQPAEEKLYGNHHHN
jgi:hypothetical protein